jgi:hypothetical protein
MNERGVWVLLLLGLACSSWWVVYTRYVDLYAISQVANRPFRDWSLEQYSQTLAGARPFPYQWRVLGFWSVAALQRLTGADHHLIDAFIKTVALTISSGLLYLFATALVGEMSAIVATTLYLLANAAAFAPEGYAIYFTNDFLAVAAWFGAVLAVYRRQWALAALAVFAGAWAKETMLLAVILVAFEAVRGRAPWWAVALCVVAFAIPTATVRTLYPAPFSKWAWWDSAKVNVPFVVLEREAIVTALRNNLKVLLFLNAGWLLAAAEWRRTTDPFLRSLAATLAVYVGLAWAVVFIRELRHMLPFTILVLPLAARAIERAVSRSPTRSP